MKADFAELIGFLKIYSFEHTAQDPKFIENVTKSHKRYYALLTLLAEIEHQGLQPVPKGRWGRVKMNKAFIDHLSEGISDIGLAFFISLHGAYKGGR
jgi:hypothetical protein